MNVRIAALLFTALGLTACNQPPKSPREVLSDLDRYAGSTVKIQATLKAGIRCELDTEDGEWQTYCGDCQSCEGPYVVDLGPEGEEWPMVLSGTHESERIGCSGKLNEVECFPMTPGETYVIEGVLERSNPPKLIVDAFRPADD
mgnify:CR=1 FL=1